jgi:two-component system, OmpR family, sensor kinase
MRQLLSLRVRLTLLTALLTGGTVLLFALVFYLVLQANLLSEIDKRLEERAALVTATFKPRSDEPGEGTHLLALSPLVEFDAPGIYVELIAPDGEVRVRSPNLPAGALSNSASLTRRAQKGATITATVPAGDDDQLRVLITPVQLDAHSTGVLVVAESLEPFLRTLAQARVLLLICGVLALTLAVGGATLLTGRALAPIVRLTQAAARIAVTSHYHDRVPIARRSDEIGQLAVTINDLIATVERTVEQQRQFLADTSHELRSPLTTVLANLNLLRRDLDQHQRALSIQEATAEAQRMRRLVNDLLLLAHSDAAQVIAQAPVRLDWLVEETIATVARQADTHSIQIQVDSPLLVIGDHERLTQLLRNLLENALHHTPAGTAISVEARALEDVAQITVADTGPGIAAEHLGRIWDRFYRVDKARSRAFGDSGLGLAIVKYIAEAHGGCVGVVSAEEWGTTFTIKLPLASDTLQVAEEGVYSAQL